ncbi:secreted frizzled-related protein 2-like [Coregonus clupeaformis]|uniref:secreted frizzled-related protein 2-like n=1 Tax=Coregonus clupeaformis TaxID=59861 RepID=UPI001BE02A8A|nr:secreted frizzled-related protein 2-like [Coregonus clupeaformis]
MAQLKISLCVLVSICLASVLSIDSSVQFASESLSSSTVRSVCKSIPSTLSLCHGVGYREMRLPNLLGHDSLKVAQQQSAAWLPLVSKLCHRDTKKFLCSLFAPVCLPEGPVRPCRGLCEAVRDGCLPVMSAFGFPWPDMFNCTRFPCGTHLCIPTTTRDTECARKGEEEGHEGVSKGTVICDACSLAAEGEKDIQNNFCNSPYAFKLRIGSVSVEGGDRRIVPLGRSRILRWEGGGAERAEGVGGAMAYSALWLQEGGTCTCPPLEEADGGEGEGKGSLAGVWYLGLAGAQEGRLVLSSLVRWRRGVKELKKFIRRLLKQPC